LGGSFFFRTNPPSASTATTASAYPDFHRFPRCRSELDMGRVHPWVGLGWVGSGPESKLFNKYTVYTQETTMIHNDEKF